LITADRLSIKKLCVIGLGYVGLPTAGVFASRGLAVLGVDVNQATVNLVNAGRVHIVEPDLDFLVNSAVATGKLRAATTPEPADAFIIAVPTPLKDDHAPDLSFLKAASDALAVVLKKGDLVIVESTSPVGTTELVSQWLAEQRIDLKFPHNNGESADILIAHSPERVLPGRVLVELTRNDRVVGGISRRCAERAAALYKIAIDGRCLLTTARTAELVKLAENAYRDVNIAFANELSLVSEALDIDVWEAIALANHHPRVNILQPGPGVGGHCIAVDPWFIVDSAPDISNLIRTARQVNNSIPGHVVAAVKAAIDGMKYPVVACLGLAYKADIDDLRESPAVEITAAIADTRTARVLVVEPHLKNLPACLDKYENLTLTDLETALNQAEILVLLTDHLLFKELDQKRLIGKRVIDTRGIWR